MGILRHNLAPLREFVAGIIRSKRSLSQFGEDSVLEGMLGRLAHEAGHQSSRKRYIDVGANRPFVHSNSYFLYKSGWSGILAEPQAENPLSYSLLRPKDLFLPCCIGASVGSITIYSFGRDHVCNTTDLDAAFQTSRRYNMPYMAIDVPMMTLSAAVARAKLNVGDIGAIFVDVEGHEMAVLSDLITWDERPDFVVAEVLVNEIGSVEGSDVSNLMRDLGYKIYAWPCPSVIYLRSDLHDRLDRMSPKEAVVSRPST